MHRLGFSAQAATYIMGDQGIDSLDELKVLDDKEVDALCKVVRKPGGTASTAGTTVSLQNTLTTMPSSIESESRGTQEQTRGQL